MLACICVCVSYAHTDGKKERGREQRMSGGLTQIRKSNKNSKSSEKHASQGLDKGNKW